VTLSDFVTILGREPFNVPAPVAVRMTMDQIAATLRSPKDIAPESEDGPTARDLHRKWAMQNRVPDWLEAELWKGRG
jgi:hypothetical protein